MRPNSLKEKSSLSKNTVALGIGALVSRILGVVLFIILARYLGPEQFGVYNIALSFVQIFVLFANFGVDAIYIRNVSREKKLSTLYFSTSLYIKLTISILSFFLLLIVARIANYNDLIFMAIAIYGISIIFQTILELISSAFKAEEMMNFVTYIQVTRSLLAIFFVGGVLFAKLGVNAVLCAQSAAFLLVGILFIVILIKKEILSIDFNLNLTFCKYMVATSLPFIFIGIIHIINFRMDIIMLSFLTNEKIAGYYSVANEFVVTLYIIPSIVATAIFPRISRGFELDVASFLKIFNFSLKLVIIVGVPIGFGLFSFSPEIVNFLFGDQYNQSVIVMKILSVGIILTYSRLIFSWSLSAMNHEKIALREYIICICVNIVLNIILIPHYKAAGAAIATVASSVIGILYLYLQTKNLLNGIKFVVRFLKPIICSSVMILILKLAPSLHIVFTVISGIVLYAVSAYLVGLFSREEIAILQKVVKK